MVSCGNNLYNMPDVKTITCCNCSQTITFDIYHDHNGDIYCPDCFSESFVECEYCGDVIPIDDSHVANNDTMCDDCYYERYASCDKCENVVETDTVCSVGDDYVCQNCFDSYCFTCHSCNDNFYDVGSYLIGCETYCQNCYSESYCMCDNCGEVVHNDNVCCNDDGVYCENCYPGSNDGLLSYDYRPSWDYHKCDDERTSLYFGIELEIESKDNDIESIVGSLPSYFYAKSDGSLDRGFEIVSHPASYRWLVRNYKIWEQILNLRQQGCRSSQTGTCGMHIHISKEYFGTLHLYKLLKFFHENPDFILKISQRNVDSFNSWSSLDTHHDDMCDDESIIYKAKEQQGNYKRFSAINLQNDDTIEIRIFKGTLNPRSFWKNIEFLMALIEFTDKNGIQDMTADKFLEYADDERIAYPNLCNWLDDKNLLLKDAILCV